ncbi:hypothetical protein D9M71_626740 [compost metagenome]
MVEPGRTLFIQADRTGRTMLQSDALVCLPERLQVLAVAVFNSVIEQVHHLPYVSEVSGESGLLNSLITCTGLPEPKG